jgi:hypothetical protein
MTPTVDIRVARQLAPSLTVVTARYKRSIVVIDTKILTACEMYA